MSWWTYVNGIVIVSVPGRTQPEIEYILRTVLDHLPVVTGSERDMEVYINKEKGLNSSSSCDEYGMTTNNLTDRYGGKSRKYGWLRTNGNFVLTVNGSLRDRMFNQTFREFMKWLCRLSKRLRVYSVLVKIEGYDQSTVLNYSQESALYYMNEFPSWCEDSDGEPAWWEHLMWKRYEDWPLPIEHIVKYYNCPEADEEFEQKMDSK